MTNDLSACWLALRGVSLDIIYPGEVSLDIIDSGKIGYVKSELKVMSFLFGYVSIKLIFIGK